MTKPKTAELLLHIALIAVGKARRKMRAEIKTMYWHEVRALFDHKAARVQIDLRDVLADWRKWKKEWEGR